MATTRTLPMPVVYGVIIGGATLMATAVQLVVLDWAVSGVAALVGIVAGLVVAELIRDQHARRE